MIDSQSSASGEGEAQSSLSSESPFRDTPRGIRLRDVGPAIIVASVVLGPGSILTASRVGAESGATMLWVLLLAAAVMGGTAALAARVGTGLLGSPCDELAARLGRPVAVLVGGTLFLVVVGFQSSNNLAVVAALEPLLTGGDGQRLSRWAQGAVLLVVNGAVIAAVCGLRGLYGKLEGLMRALVAVMAAAFLLNLLAARPSIREALAGFVPSLPAGEEGGFLPRRDAAGEIVVPLLAVQGMIATTFSVAGAFYQAYLVKEKGWGRADGRRAGIEATIGAAALAFMTGTILLTAAATLHGANAGGFKTTADLAEQLRPFFGDWAVGIFATGICAGALGSFLGNALIGGTLLSDGLGRGTALDSTWVRGATVAALLVGAAAAGAVIVRGGEQVSAIVVMQSLTVLGGPLLAAAILYLGSRVTPRPPAWTFVAAAIGAAIVLLLSVRSACQLWLKAFAE